MIKKLIISVFLLQAFSVSYAQKGTLAIQEWSSAANSPLVFYITGDGGLNEFSKGLCSRLNKSGYQVAALDARSYFWKKKTSDQAADEIAAYVAEQLQARKNQQWVFIGYSFGADVLPFIVNNLPDKLKQKLENVVLISPSTTTDFEIHLTDMLSMSKKRKMEVVPEINKMGVKKAEGIFGSEDKLFPVKKITLENYSSIYLPGGHNFDKNFDEIVDIILKNIR